MDKQAQERYNRLEALIKAEEWDDLKARVAAFLLAKNPVLIDGKPIETTVEKKGDVYSVEAGDSSFEIQRIAPGLFSVVVDGQKKTIAAASSNGTTYVDIDSVLLELKEPSEDGYGAAEGEHAGEKDKIYAPMPGKIVKLLVDVGDAVEAKQSAVIVEAMKMENPVQAQAAGTVKAINFAVGDQVDTDSPIIELELAEP